MRLDDIKNYWFLSPTCFLVAWIKMYLESPGWLFYTGLLLIFFNFWHGYIIRWYYNAYGNKGFKKNVFEEGEKVKGKFD